MTITVAAVYEGGGVLKLEGPIELREKARVTVTIETAPEATAGDNDPTGWKAAEQFIGMWKDAPARSSTSLSEEHDRLLYGRR